MERQYFGKILLFGEYSIICGSKGLVIPYVKASGEWKFAIHDHDRTAYYHESAMHLHAFMAYLGQQPELNDLLDIKQLAIELEKGLFFDSNIPQGYGAGSSGALVAAVFDRFARKSLPTEPIALKRLFALAESFFHGSSSGIDPLACYLNKTLLIGPDKTITTIKNPLSTPQSASMGVFLLDTKTTGITAPLVGHFRERLHEYKFYRALRDVYIPATNLAISQLINHEHDAFLNALTKIAEFQREEMSKMIPDNFGDYFCEATPDQPFTLKLCGSGGGGFLLGFTVSHAETSAFFAQKALDIRWINEP